MVMEVLLYVLDFGCVYGCDYDVVVFMNLI